MRSTESALHLNAGIRRARATLAFVAVLAIGFAPGLTTFAASHADPYPGMPDPVAMLGPASTGTSAADATYATGESSVRVRDRQDLYLFSSRTASVVNEREVDFGFGAVFSSPGETEQFGDREYVQLTSGTYEGWWVAATRAAPSSMTRYSTPISLRLSARDYIGVRFYSGANVRTRLRITLNTESTFHADRRAVFGGRSFYRMTDGPLASRWVSAGAVSRMADSDSTDNTPSAAPVATWRGVFLVYNETDVTYKRGDGSSYRLRTSMTNTMKNLVSDTVSRFRSSVSNWSGGLAAMELDVVNVPHAITQLDSFGSSYWVGPSSVQDDIDRYAPAGRYDSVFVIWDAHDEASGNIVPVGAWGLTLPPGSWANGAGYSSIITPTWEWWWADSRAPEEVFIHEWMHQVIFFNESEGRAGIDLHAPTQYGYQQVNGSWKNWLSDVMQGKVWDGSKYIGISSDDWAQGSPRNP